MEEEKTPVTKKEMIKLIEDMIEESNTMHPQMKHIGLNHYDYDRLLWLMLGVLKAE